MNGKKTFTGLGLVCIGMAMFKFPFTAPAAPYFVSSGLGLLGVGSTHKIIKRKNKE
jgi:hypothetical protein